MSYTRYIDGYQMNFKDEECFLHCRLNYLEYQKACNYDEGGTCVTFDWYIREEMYDKDECEVESIVPPAIIDSPLVGDLVTAQGSGEVIGIVTDTSTNGSTQTDDNNYLTISVNTVNDNENLYSTESIQNAMEQLEQQQPITSYYNCVFTNTDSIGISDASTWSLGGSLGANGEIHVSNVSLDSDFPIKKGCESEKKNVKKEESIDPINNRFEILDL